MPAKFADYVGDQHLGSLLSKFGQSIKYGNCASLRQLIKLTLGKLAHCIGIQFIFSLFYFYLCRVATNSKICGQ
jgi:hypothetical protein